MGALRTKYRNSQEIFADVAVGKNTKKLCSILYRMVEDGVDTEDLKRDDLIVLEAMNTLREDVGMEYIGGVGKRLKTLLLPILKTALQTGEESKYTYHFCIDTVVVSNLKRLYEKLLGNRSHYVQHVAAVAAVLAYTRYKWYPDEAAALLSDINDLDDTEFVTLMEAAIRSSAEQHCIDQATEFSKPGPNTVEYAEDDSTSDDTCVQAEPQLTPRQLAARKRLRKGTPAEMSSQKSPDTTSGLQTKTAPEVSPRPAAKTAPAVNKTGKGKLIAKIVLKVLCCIFGLAIIALAVLQFVTTEGLVPEEERIGALVGQLLSGAFACGLWLFYYGTIIALKKAGFQVLTDMKDPSFWEIVSVTTTVAYYSDGSVKKSSSIEMRGSFTGEIVIFFIVFTLVQTYYLVAAPILSIVSLCKDINTLKNWNRL